MVLVACGGGEGEVLEDSPKRPATPASPSPSPTVVGPVFPHEVGPIPAPVGVVSERLGIGAPPRVEYVAGLGDDQVVVRPDGRVAATLEVDPMGNEGYRHVSFAPCAEGWLTGFDNMGSSATIMRADGSFGDVLGFGPEGVFSRADRREIVFSFSPDVGTQPVVATLGPSGLRRVGPADSTAGFLGTHEVVVTRGRAVFRVDLRNDSWTRVAGVSSVTMAASRTGWLIGEAMGKHGVFDATTGEPILGSPTYKLVGFSPSGRRVIGYRASPRGVLMVVADVATGRVIRSFRWRAPYEPMEVVWEDEGSVLVDFIRFGLDGTVERPQLLGSADPDVPNLLPPPIS